MKITKEVKFETTMGDIIIGLYGEEMPVSSDNFIKHVEAGFYKNLIFHRIIDGFVVQGGGYMSGMIEKKEMVEPIKLEISPKIKHTQYTLSMARTNEPNSATSQFFICLQDVPSLDNQYAAFGTVLEGKEVVDAMGKIETKTVRWFEDVPKKDIVITNAYVLD